MLLAKSARRAAVREGRPPLPQRGYLVDSARFRARGGRGGSGTASFEPVGRGRHLTAAGGSGGPGGDVIIRASRDVSSLYGISTVIAGTAGGRGGSNGQTGGGGATAVLEVPLGTRVQMGPLLDAGAEAIDQSDEDDEYVYEDLGDEQEEHDASEDETDEYDDGAARRGRRRAAPAAARSYTHSEPEAEPPAPSPRSIAQTPPGALRPNSGSSARSARPGAHSRAESEPESDEELEPRRRAGDGAEDMGGDRAEAVQGAGVDLDLHGQELVVARGGAGGRGNKAFEPRPGRPAPDTCEPGQPGEERWVRLSTRLLADVGFVGLPNAGKSTLLGAITAARAKVGSYAFTTIRPQLGAIQYEDGARLVTADIPGLVQGAHANKGRGNAFLRHIERCRVLAFVVDLSGSAGPGAAGTAGGAGGAGGAGAAGAGAGGSAGAGISDGEAGAAGAGGREAGQGGGAAGGARGRAVRRAALRRSARAGPAPGGPAQGEGERQAGAAAHEAQADVDVEEAGPAAPIGRVPLAPAEQLRVLQEELRLYNPALASAPALVVANKTDAAADPRGALASLAAATPLPIVPVSAARGAGLARLKAALRAIAGAEAGGG
ncbi:hypothetical protein HYH03_015847 [Edaphochlamys debaryana]|uniref:Uncharacterized protein n=1 Tax=Edaphochlamys debaryana TaxID=47281 RepID=A0A836BQJ2_9CHLO|nr:hypothetical protein HYH03_015847 [Edaphochlamys debaryana]|eukprot:KAG2485471.1 hypothetical protein HYH03_015847 [Edaphochlamys debaryana]